MVGWLKGAMLAVVAAMTTAVPAAALPERVRTGAAGSMLEWPQAPANARYRVGNLSLSMRNIVSGTDASELRRELRVEAPGTTPFTIAVDEDIVHAPQVMVLRTPSGAPAFLFQTFSGGSHCCTEVTYVEAQGGAFRPVVVSSGDGGGFERAPRDLNRDGRLDFVGYDNAFLYTFASYAESFAPTTVTNVIDGRAVDVSDQPAFRRLYEADARTARAACIGNSTGRNGACAAYVAASARLGRFDAAWAEMLRHYQRDSDSDLPRGCRTARGDRCPDAQEIVYRDFPSALRNFLIETGYIRR